MATLRRAYHSLLTGWRRLKEKVAR